MSTRIRFFRVVEQAAETERYLNSRGIKTFSRMRNASNTASGEECYGCDLFVLRDDDLENAKMILEYEFGSGWGEGVRGS